jgi:aminoglycoside 3-N-acetyltransferase I
MNIRVDRLNNGDRGRARALFRKIAEVFGERGDELDEVWIDRLLEREDFWALAAYDGESVIGGLTAHTLPMTRAAVSEIFIYDIAVDANHQRRGVGRMLVEELRRRAGESEVFVAADNEDTHALDFYRALGGEAAPVTMFTF